MIGTKQSFGTVPPSLRGGRKPDAAIPTVIARRAAARRGNLGLRLLRVARNDDIVRLLRVARNDDTFILLVVHMLQGALLKGGRKPDAAIPTVIARRAAARRGNPPPSLRGGRKPDAAIWGMRLLRVARNDGVVRLLRVARNDDVEILRHVARNDDVERLRHVVCNDAVM